MLASNIIRLVNACRNSGSTACLSTINSNDLTITRTNTPADKPKIEELVFGKYFADHMLICDFESGKWLPPKIEPFKNFSMSPASTCLHYGIQCFEGMKAYKTADKDIRLFRPMLNMERMQRTAEKLTLPAFDANEVLKCLKKLIELDGDWVPDSNSASLYIRPTFISTDPVIGVKPPTKARLYVISGPVGPYYEQTGTELFKSVKLMADPQFVRAWEGGIGAYKAGGNYAPTLYIQRIAGERGCQQVLWLYGKEQQLTEAGTMNFFVFWRNKYGEKELVTPPLSSGLILPGVTRQSVLDLAREWGEFKVSEKVITMEEFITANNENRIIEVFGSGTACMICPVHGILYDGQDIEIPTMKTGAELSRKIFHTLTDIQTGRVEHKWSESVYQQ